MEETHKTNLELIKKYNLKVGDKFKLKEDYYYLKKGEVVTISQIHSLYGWILFKETEQLPQEVEKLLNLFGLKGDINKMKLKAITEIKTKEEAREEAKRFQNWVSETNLSYSETSIFGGFFETLERTRL